MTDQNSHFSLVPETTPLVGGTPMERMRAEQAEVATEKRSAWEVISAVIADPLAPAHLPLVFSGTGIFMVLLLGVSGALSNGDKQKPKKMTRANQQFTAAQRAAAPVITNSVAKRQPDNNPFQSQIIFLEAKVAVLENQLNRMKSDLDVARSGNQTLARRLTSVETRFGSITASINRKQTILPAVKNPKNGAGTKTLPPLSALPPTTGSPPITNNDTPEFSQTRFAAFLGTNTSRIDLQNYREQLRAKYASLFKGLNIYLAQPAKGEKKFRLIAGPVTNMAIVTRICVGLKADGKFCHQDIFPKTLLTGINPQ